MAAVVAAFVVGVPQARAQQSAPVIDAHFHAFTASWQAVRQGPRDTAWYPRALPRVSTTEELVRENVTQLRQHNIVRVIASSYDLADVELYRRAAPDRVIPALMLVANTNLDSIRAWHAAGRVAVLGEAMWQYQGLSPADSALEPLWRLAEELDLPVGVHMGLGPPGVQNERPYRMRLSDPLQLEEVLVRHPRLRVYVMHAGWPLLDRIVGLLFSYPNVYVDVGVIDWYIPRPEFHTYLRRLVEAGFADRVMFGSDQMQWPAAMPIAIQAVESATFLAPAQKRDILCRNAVRFFRLDPQLCD